jgi:hypothetical protein
MTGEAGIVPAPLLIIEDPPCPFIPEIGNVALRTCIWG